MTKILERGNDSLKLKVELPLPLPEAEPKDCCLTDAGDADKLEEEESKLWGTSPSDRTIGAIEAVFDDVVVVVVAVTVAIVVAGEGYLKLAFPMLSVSFWEAAAKLTANRRFNGMKIIII